MLCGDAVELMEILSASWMDAAQSKARAHASVSNEDIIYFFMMSVLLPTNQPAALKRRDLIVQPKKFCK